MKSDKHRNWLLTILKIRLPFIFWGSIVLVLIIVALTFLFKPIYSARTILTLDADLTKVLRNVEANYPSTTALDFIRYEYFATHSVNLMRVPQLGERFVENLDIRDRWGNPLFPEFLIEPSIFQLLFSNNGQGIRIEWVSDTQQFSISGFAKDPDRAVLFSTDYAKLFLKENSDQFKDILNQLAERFDLQRASIISKIDAIDKEICQIYSHNKTADRDLEIEGLTNRILGAKDKLDEARFMEKTYQRRINFLQQETKKYEKLKDYEVIMTANPQIQYLKESIEELTRKLLAISVDYTPDSPEYKAMEKQLNHAKETLQKEARESFFQGTKRMLPSLQTVLDSAVDLTLAHLVYQTQVKHYEAIIEKHNERLEELTAVRATIDNLENDKKTLTNMLTKNNGNRQAIDDILKRSLSFFRVVSFARINKDNLKYYKYFPKRKVILVLTLMGALFSLSFFVIARELYANTLYQGWQTSALEGPIDYADVPHLRHLKKNASGIEPIVCKYIRQLCLATKDSQIIRISSGAAGEGKATIARVLAWYYRKTGKSVVLLDGDLEYRSLSAAIGLDMHDGLSEYLYGEKTLADTVIATAIPGISIIPAGSTHVIDPDAPVSERCKKLFADLISEYDKIVFVDLPSNDNRLMLSDYLPLHDVIIVLQSGKHSIYEVERMAKIRDMTGCQSMVKGVIINQI